MNAVEIEDAVTRLAEQPFDQAEFPFAFLMAFGNKETTIRRLRSGATNKSDLGGVLQSSNIHIAVAEPGEVTRTLLALKASPSTSKAKARFILATDGDTFEAEDLETGLVAACDFADFPDHFSLFLPLAGISTVRQVQESAFDIRATARLNRLYVELLKDNPEWGTVERRHDMNHFMARLIFCFFAEDTDIFNGTRLFTLTVDQMSARDASNTHEVIGEIFRAMDTKISDRATSGLRPWADAFPYVNGELFSGSVEVPRFSRIARSYLIHIGNLDWTKINPDIFGSMIQAVAEDEERGALGMHYTSVPNILKVLNPLFLDDLREKLEDAGDNSRTLLNLRRRMARIRVFDPACGSGNFLVIAYKEMRAIEAEINRRRGEQDRRSDIPLTNFRGIELRDFPAEIARLALIIAEFQCDVLYRGQKEALAEFLPLDAENWITCGNALRLDWLSVCPPTGTGVKLFSDDMFETPLEQVQIDFENEGGETYICGNPPYLGSQWQTDDQKQDLQNIFDGRSNNWGSLDYVAGWFMKAADYGITTPAAAAFVATNSICQGRQANTLWPLIFSTGHEIAFAHSSFKWTNLASHNAGVTVIIVGISSHADHARPLFSDGSGGAIVKLTDNINSYLVPGPNVTIAPHPSPLADLANMSFGSMPNDGGHLLVDLAGANEAVRDHGVPERFIRPFVGSQEFIRGTQRRCVWIGASDFAVANSNAWLRDRFAAVAGQRQKSDRSTTKALAATPYRFGEVRQSGAETAIVVPSVSSESREYLPVGYVRPGTIISNLAFGLYDAPLWNMALIASRIHLVWIGTVCGKMKTDFRYSNTLGWNTFPVPALTDKNKADLIRCAEDILLAREAHFPATIADLYDPDAMPANLRAAHERNDEVLERIYTVPSVSVTYSSNGASTKANSLGMRPMQERAYERRGEQYLLIKSPPASGKSRALMFIALDKLANQGLKQAIIVVPEKSIGASFNDEPLSHAGFFADWTVVPRWNLCNAPGEDGGKVNSVGAFLAGDDKVLVCTHATFRFAVDKFGVEAFDNRLIAIDEFHHVSADPESRLGSHLSDFIARDKVHVVAMTGSYFRGDAVPVLAPQDEARFDTVTYTYYEQLNGYQFLKQLDIGYFFYSGPYSDDILKVLDPAEKTIIHIPSVNSRESTKDKIREVEHIIEELGVWQGTDPATGFQLVTTKDGRTLRIADLVDDDPGKRDRVAAALKDASQKHNRDHVDIIIALGMAKEGFDWIWCEHALTVGYRSSLTEIVQIIGRATRDAPGKTRARFTNLIAEPDASEEAVTEAINDTLKAIAASLLMEQVLAPRFEFKPKNPQSAPVEGFDYGAGGYDPRQTNIGFNEATGQFQIEIKGLVEPRSDEAVRICREDLNEVIATFVQDKTAIERGLFDDDLVPEELTQVRLGKIIKEKYPNLDNEDQEAVRQHAIAAINLTQQAKRIALAADSSDDTPSINTALIDGVRKFAMDVRELDIDLIDRINPFGEAYAILSKAMSEDSLKQVAAAIAAKRTALTPDEARELAVRAVRFKKERGRLPSISAQDPWEQRMAEGAAAFVRFKDEGRYE